MGKFYYKEISGEQVDPGILRQAKIALGFCKKDLGLSGAVYIQWCRAVTKEDFDLYGKDEDGYKKFLVEFYGSTSANKSSDIKNRILLRADIPPKDILYTLAHECRHIADRDFHGDYSITWHLSDSGYQQSSSEIRANAYADRVVPKIQEQIEILRALEKLAEGLKALGGAVNHD